MSLDKKKRAALAAVMQYLQDEEQGMYAVEMQAAPARPVVAIPDRTMLSMVGPWGLTGRNQQMQTRAMMQLRAFRR